MASKKNEVVVLATVSVKPGKEAELERALRDAAKPTRAQRGCLQFERYRAAQNPATMTAFERRASEADHERHFQGDHVKRLIARFDGIVAGPPDILSMKPL